MRRSLLAVLLWLLSLCLFAPTLAGCSPRAQQIVARSVSDLLLPYVQNVVSRGQVALTQVETKYNLAATLAPDPERDKAVAVALMECSQDLDFILQVVNEANFTRASVDAAIKRFQDRYRSLLAIVSAIGVRPQNLAENIAGAAPDGSVLVVTPPEAFALPPSAGETGSPSAPTAGGT